MRQSQRRQYERTVAVLSGAPLPLARLAARVEAGNHKQRFAFESEKQHVGQTLQESAAYVLEYGRKLQRVCAYPFNFGVDLGAKPTA